MFLTNIFRWLATTTLVVLKAKARKSPHLLFTLLFLRPSTTAFSTRNFLRFSKCPPIPCSSLRAIVQGLQQRCPLPRLLRNLSSSRWIALMALRTFGGHPTPPARRLWSLTLWVTRVASSPACSTSSMSVAQFVFSTLRSCFFVFTFIHRLVALCPLTRAPAFQLTTPTPMHRVSRTTLLLSMFCTIISNSYAKGFRTWTPLLYSTTVTTLSANSCAKR